MQTVKQGTLLPQRLGPTFRHRCRGKGVRIHPLIFQLFQLQPQRLDEVIFILIGKDVFGGLLENFHWVLDAAGYAVYVIVTAQSAAEGGYMPENVRDVQEIMSCGNFGFT